MNITRRGLIAAAAAAAVLPTFRSTKAAGGEVIIATTGGMMTNSLQAHFYKRFEAETGIRVRAVAIELPDQWARAVAGARSGSVPFDVVTATPPDLIQQAGLLETIDCAGMPGIAAHALPNGCMPKGIIRTVGGMSLTWSKKAFPNGGPQSWADFLTLPNFPDRARCPILETVNGGYRSRH
jgi:mannopine transport system substrate-binding protein